MKKGTFLALAGLVGSVAACSSDAGDSASSGGGGDSSGATLVEGDILSDTTWTRDSDYLLRGVVRVQAGATLTIEAGTTVFGEKASSGTLVVQRGGQIHAVGSADAPIVFTSELPEGLRAAGDWGGVVILGNAPINEPGNEAAIEGFTSDELYGGDDAADSSGQLSYVRIEYSGIEISPDNEINGLTFGGVGNGTQVDHIMVRHTLDDCFEFFGGSVDASHLICYRNGDDGFDFDQGYQGKLQFLFLQQDPTVADSANGFEADNDATEPDIAPVTNPTIYNVTLCGQNAEVSSQQFGMLLRRGFNATIGNAIVSGFEAAVDIRDRPFTEVSIHDSTFFGNAPENIAYAEDGSNEDTQEDDDDGFDEVGWFLEGANNDTSDPALRDCFGATPDPTPSVEIGGVAPPSDGFFDSDASFRGAFRDATDNWASGAWISWE